jgi:hypothetical protein
MSGSNDRSIRVGTMSQLQPPKGEWLLVDMGFSNDSPTCGVLSTVAGDWAGEGACMGFGQLVDFVSRAFRTEGDPLHLVLEAPLSGFFDARGNPLGRASEKSDTGQTRYWYVGLGGSMAMASLYLLRNALAEPPRREVRLFEGFVSFKRKGDTSDHVADVDALRNALAVPEEGSFVDPHPVKKTPGFHQESLLGFLLGGAPAAPPIIVAHPKPARDMAATGGPS